MKIALARAIARGSARSLNIEKAAGGSPASAIAVPARRSASAKNEVPVLLTSPQVRPFVRSIVERFRPLTVVMSQNEIHASVRLRTLGQV